MRGRLIDTARVASLLRHTGVAAQIALLDAIGSCWLPLHVITDVTRLVRTKRVDRIASAMNLAGRPCVLRDVSAAAIGYSGTAQFISPRIGYRTFSPFGFGPDIAAMCVAGNS
jgi:hypothetical protein